ncbi:hypothetical protein Tco_1570799 [Tanacetum coccineum]
MLRVLSHPTLPVEVPYIPDPEYPEYLVPSDAEAPLEDQPLPTDALPTALSLGYMVDFDPDKNPEEDLEEDHADYLADGGDDDDEPPDNDRIRALETDGLHLHHITSIYRRGIHSPSLRTCLRRAQKTVILEPPMSPSMKARIANREDIPEAELPPCKRLCPTAPTSRYEVGESSTAAARPTGCHRADYRFIGTTDADIKRWRADEVGYGIRDVWVDPTEAVEEVAPTTLEGVNARVIELSTVQEQDIQDIYVVIEMDRFQALQARDQTNAMISLTGPGSSALGQLDLTICHQESLLFARAAAAVARAAGAAVTTTPMTAAAVNQLIEARVSMALANHDTLRNSTNGHGDGSHNSETRIRGTSNESESVVAITMVPRSGISVPYHTNCVVENQVKFATCTFLGNALTWWNSHMKTVTQDVAYAMD